MKNIFSLLTLLISVNNINAQNSKQEIGIGIGILSRPYIRDAMRPGMVGIWDDYNTSGTFSIYYQRKLSGKVDIGIGYLFELQNHHYRNSANPWDETITPAKNTYHTLILSTKYNWVQKGTFNLYSFAGIGASLFIEKTTYYYNINPLVYKETNVNFAYQVTPIGVRVGKKLGGFIELGYGYKGILAGGLNYRF